MTNEEFINVLDEKGYSHEIEGDKLIVINTNHNGIVNPSIDLQEITSIPPNVIFNNSGYVFLTKLTSIPPNVTFNNRRYIDLRNCLKIDSSVIFNNEGSIFVDKLITDKWEGNIKGIGSNRLFKLMISKGLFER
jgi:hypothetical protein